MHTEYLMTHKSLLLGYKDHMNGKGVFLSGMLKIQLLEQPFVWISLQGKDVVLITKFEDLLQVFSPLEEQG